MPRNLTYQTKALLWVVLVLVLWWLLPGVVQRWAAPAFAEFQAPAWRVGSHLSDLRSYWSLQTRGKDDLISAGVEMSRLNAAYALRNQQLDSLEEEVEHLQAFFGLPSLPSYRYEVARVMRRDINAWWQHLQIRKGHRHGVRVGQAVVYDGGVVGRVSEVQAWTATVELIGSARFRAAAHVEGDLRPVEFRGRGQAGLRPGIGHVFTVPADVEVSIDRPLRLVSSRLGGVFPDGLTLGYIHRLEPTPDGLFQRGTVQLDPRLMQLREVAVMVAVDAPEALEEQ
jgi:rod shape-determining protein MreC